SRLTLDEQLEVLVQRLGQAVQAQRILVALVDPGDPERFHQCLAHDVTRPDPWLRHLDLSSGRYPELQEAIRMGRPLVIPDVPAEVRLDAIRNHLKHLDLRSLIVVPLIVRERAIGAVSLGYVGQGRTFPPEEISLFQSFATQAAIAIEKARLYQEIQHHAAELEQRVYERTRELEAANAQLQAASRHKSEFLANMSHELRTPLNSIIGFAELVGEQRVGPLTEKQARYIGHIHTSGKHLLQIINEILDLAKVEAGKFTLRPEPLLVAGTLEDILVIARGLANKKSQEIQAEIAPDLPPLVADPVRFKQILFNLLSNAAKFTPEGGRITVTARRVTEDRRPETDAVPRPPSPVPCLEIRVTDTGIGIKSEDLPRLFQEFVQLDATASKRDEGTGLGLALTERLVEMHGGRIWAESKGAGRGSTFTVVLPFEVPGDAQDASPEPIASRGVESF
ncbi:MAG: GAF domain-containing protein, partial [candidate division NC10 bacterium]|nr:GAF domain-containing protein [candidate division NC10 bacterium]